MRNQDTITAIATGTTNAGISIIRISGSNALPIADEIFVSKNSKTKLTEVKSHTLHYGTITDGEMMLDEAKILSELPLHSIKFHQLILVKNTPIIKDWKENPQDFIFMQFDEYKEFMIDFLERLSPHIVIERFAGEVPPRFQEVESNWQLLRNETLVQKIEQRMIERNTYQGRLFK